MTLALVFFGGVLVGRLFRRRYCAQAPLRVGDAAVDIGDVAVGQVHAIGCYSVVLKRDGRLYEVGLRRAARCVVLWRTQNENSLDLRA